jgi:hypothetical protein
MHSLKQKEWPICSCDALVILPDLAHAYLVVAGRLTDSGQCVGD